MRTISSVVFFVLIATISMAQKNKSDKPVETELIQDDYDWINKYLLTADSLIGKFYQGPITEKYNPKVLDEVFKVCLRELAAGKITPETIEESLGGAFGTYLNTTLDSHWLIVTDSYGTALAVKFKNGGYAFPLSSVSKRLESKENGFFNALYEEFRDNY